MSSRSRAGARRPQPGRPGAGAGRRWGGAPGRVRRSPLWFATVVLALSGVNWTEARPLASASALVDAGVDCAPVAPPADVVPPSNWVRSGPRSDSDRARLEWWVVGVGRRGVGVRSGKR